MERRRAWSRPDRREFESEADETLRKQIAQSYLRRVAGHVHATNPPKLREALGMAVSRAHPPSVSEVAPAVSKAPEVIKTDARLTAVLEEWAAKKSPKIASEFWVGGVKAYVIGPQHAYPGHGQLRPEQLEIERLRHDVAKLKAERDVQKSRGLLRGGVDVKFGFPAKHRGIWPAAWMCEALGISRSGFHAWLTRSPSARARRDEQAASTIRASFLGSDRTYRPGASGATSAPRGSPVACTVSSG